MESVGAGGGQDKGGIDFSLANLCRCMCFTHEDTEASDNKVSIILLTETIKLWKTFIKFRNSVFNYQILILDPVGENCCFIGRCSWSAQQN